MITPTREEFKLKARQGNLIAVTRDVLADMLTPVAAFRRLAAGGVPSFLLESVERGDRIGRYSFLGARPFLTMRAKGDSLVVTENGDSTTMTLSGGQDPLSVLEDLMARYKWVGGPDLPPFVGGAVGLMGYDLVRFFEKLPDTTKDDLNAPDALFMLADTIVVFDHLRHRLKVVCNAPTGDDLDASYDKAVETVNAVVDTLESAEVPEWPKAGGHAGEPEWNMTPEAYQEMVRKGVEYIRAGDCIQLVVSQRMRKETNADPLDVYRALRYINPSPYMFYLNLGEMILVGSSPEILVTESGGELRYRPIAGTRPRGATPEADAAMEAEMHASEKERAEHIMLVDLGRNDLGRVCSYGSVHVDELFVTERYSDVMHLVSNVRGRLRPEFDRFDALRAVFPAGTLSGAPKVRAMEIIDEMEPTRRGPYGGAVGYISFSGGLDTCICIRTVAIQGNVATVQAGAGIVSDSDPLAEHQECRNKARAVLRAIEMAERGLE
ncbi:MAG TPA: anthranilate synthase component I [Armatimonadota bacterium]|jgi:anthranilate synthase component 1